MGADRSPSHTDRMAAQAAAAAATMGPRVDAALDSPAASRWIPRLFWTPLGFALGTVFGWVVF